MNRCLHSSLAVEICAVCLDDLRIALADAQSKLDQKATALCTANDRYDTVVEERDAALRRLSRSIDLFNRYNLAPPGEASAQLLRDLEDALKGPHAGNGFQEAAVPRCGRPWCTEPQCEPAVERQEINS